MMEYDEDTGTRNGCVPVESHIIGKKGKKKVRKK